MQTQLVNWIIQNPFSFLYLDFELEYHLRFIHYDQNNSNIKVVVSVNCILL